MTPAVRRFALTVHLAVSVGMLGAVAIFFALAIVGVTSHDADLVRAAYRVAGLATWWIIVPSAFAALLTGVLSSLGTPWGLVRYYWVAIKLALTVVVVVVLLIQTRSIDMMAAMATSGPLEAGAMIGPRAGLVLHSGGGFLVLLVTTVLSIYKPRGLTRYGAARERAAREKKELAAQPR